MFVTLKEREEREYKYATGDAFDKGGLRGE